MRACTGRRHDLAIWVLTAAQELQIYAKPQLRYVEGLPLPAGGRHNYPDGLPWQGASTLRWQSAVTTGSLSLINVLHHYWQGRKQ